MPQITTHTPRYLTPWERELLANACDTRPLVSPDCTERCAEHYCLYGECARCAEYQRQLWDKMTCEDEIRCDRLLCYHENGAYKNLPRRLPHEHPRLYMGVEIEVGFDSEYVDVEYDREEVDDCGLIYINDILAKFSRITQGLFCYEQDSSTDNAVEFISRPMSYRFWTHPDTVKRLKEGFEYINRYTVGEQPTSHGLHIHLSRRFFATQAQIRNMEWMLERFQPELEQLVGRHTTSYCETHRDKLQKELRCNGRDISGWVVQPLGPVSLKKPPVSEVGFSGDHYSALSLRQRTVELRVFKSTTDVERILAYVELARSLAYAAKREEKPGGWKLGEILYCKDSPYLERLISQVNRPDKSRKSPIDMEQVDTGKITLIVEER